MYKEITFLFVSSGTYCSESLLVDSGVRANHCRNSVNLALRKVGVDSEVEGSQSHGELLDSDPMAAQHHKRDM